MANTMNTSNAVLTDMSNQITDYSVTPMNTDGPTGSGETEYTNQNWSKQFGYFNTNADLKSAILSKATWVVGKGYTTPDARTKVILESIKGWGKDTFDEILFNLDVTRRIGQDAFAEIIRDPETDELINLKVLDPSTMKIVVDEKGILDHYIQTSKFPQKGILNKIKNFVGLQQTIKFKPEEIFHLTNNRIADQIHGISDISAVEDVLKADTESFNDLKKIMHHQAVPFIMWKLKTDDATKIATFKTNLDNARKLGEDFIIPDDDDAVSSEVVQLSPSPMVMEYRNEIRKKFYRTIGLPELLPSGGGDSTESGGKIGYLAWEQIVEKEQRFWEQQIWKQLKLKINLIPPATLSQDLQTDNSKDPNAFQPSDMMAGVGR